MKPAKIWKHVPPQMPRGKCRIAFVGEAPSDEETLEGKPLVGPSGRVFNQLLRVAGIDRNDCLVTNLFDWQLEDNELENACAQTAERKTWKDYDLPYIKRGWYVRPEYAFPALERLEKEIEACDPNVIVPLGGSALWAFLGLSTIDAHRGAVAEATHVAKGRKLVPTFHPAFLFHTWGAFSVVAQDLAKARAQSAFAEIRTTPREVWVEPTLEDIREFKREYLDSAPYISVDIETLPWQRLIKCIGFSPGIAPSLVVPFIDTRKVGSSYWETLEEELAAWDAVRQILALPQPKLGQNFTYDFQWLYDKGIAPVNYSEDTRLMHHALFPEMKKSLGVLGSLYAEEKAWKLLNSSAKADEWKRED